jgi:hypothetical protein
VQQRLAPLLLANLGDGHRDVFNLVQFLVCAHSILLLQWRHANPQGSALDWLVFQTAAIVDRAFQPIAVYLTSRDISRLVGAALLAAQNCVGADDLFLVVDEAQVLAQCGDFSSANTTMSKERRLLSPFARFCMSVSFSSVWFAGTSMSLRIAEEVGLSIDAKRRPDCVVHCDMVFEMVKPFALYLTEMVGVAFSEPLIAELHARFKGRARRVAVLAEYLIADGVAAVTDVDEFHECVMDVALQCESDLLAPKHELSIVGAFIDRQQSSAERTLRMPMWVKVARHAFIESTEVNEDVDYWFDIGVGKLRRDYASRSVEIFEPLTAKMLLCAALEVDKNGALGLNPVLAPMLEMSFIKNESARGFLAEVFVIPVIHRFLLRKILRRQGGVRDFFAVPRADLVDGVQRNLSIFMPEAKAGPDAIHTFASVGAQSRGALGQIKFRAKMDDGDWEHALRTVELAQLYSEKKSAEPRALSARKAKQTRLATLKAKRDAANEVLSKQWPGGSCSYIFSICEPPADIRALADGRQLFVFSPQLCPTLFDADAPGINVWECLKAIKNIL